MMRNNIPLGDQQRFGWLVSLRKLLVDWHAKGTNGVLACSALKQKYRHLLSSNIIFKIDCNNNNENVDSTSSNQQLNLLFIMLDFEREIIAKRLMERPNHGIVNSPVLLESQFAALEKPEMSDNTWILINQNGFLNKETYSESSGKPVSHLLYVWRPTEEETESVNVLVENIDEFLKNNNSYLEA
jgi:carbohydrate kinase (thermoresistant glucokinase family)